MHTYTHTHTHTHTAVLRLNKIDGDTGAMAKGAVRGGGRGGRQTPTPSAATPTPEDQAANPPSAKRRKTTPSSSSARNYNTPKRSRKQTKRQQQSDLLKHWSANQGAGDGDTSIQGVYDGITPNASRRAPASKTRRYVSIYACAYCVAMVMPCMCVCDLSSCEYMYTPTIHVDARPAVWRSSSRCRRTSFPTPPS
jgi:hypothetical protein